MLTAISSCANWATEALARAPALQTSLGLPELEVRQLCSSPEVLQIRGLLTDEECRDVVQEVQDSGLLSASRVRSADGSGYEENPAVRDSQECVWAPDGVMALPDDALPVRVVRRLHQLLGDVARPDHVEGPKVVHYGTHQHYSEHYDWSAGLAASAAGQRTATALLYLSTTRCGEGGCTVFPRLGLRVPPERGSVLVWSNLAADGQPDRDTLHGSEPMLPPRSGAPPDEKWVVNFFYRERSYFELALAAARSGTAYAPAREDGMGLPAGASRGGDE